MKFDLLDYEAIVSYNKEQHYPFKVSLINPKENKDVFFGECVTVDQLCFVVHREMLYHDYHAASPMQTLHAVERMRDGLDLWMDKLEILEKGVKVETKLKEVSSEYAVKESPYDYYSSAFKKSGFNDGFNSWEFI